jgi:hypothetical protein
MNRFEKAAEFGAVMGKRAGMASVAGRLAGIGISRSGILNNPTGAGAGIGALVGGGGTALYDYLAGTEEGKLKRALIGAGVGGLTGGLAGHRIGMENEFKEEQNHKEQLARTLKNKEEEDIRQEAMRAASKAKEEKLNRQKPQIPQEKLTPKEMSAKWFENIGKQSAFGAMMGKRAAEVLPSSDLGGILSKSFGRINSFLPSLIIGQERAKDLLSDSNEKDHKKYIDLMNKAYPKELKDVGVRMGGTNTTDDFKRIWGSPRTTLLSKAFGTATIPFTNLNSDFNRSSHYNPITNMANVYGNIGEITAHELGHAADFNTVSSGQPSDSLNRIRRDAYTFSRIPEGYIGLGAGPMTHVAEIQANRKVNGALGLIKDKDEADRIKAETWRRLAPAYGTYAAATGLGGLALHAKYSDDPQNTPFAHLVNGTGKALKGVGLDPSVHRWALPMALSLGTLGAGVAGGRLFAEGRNLIYGPSKKVNKKPRGYASNVTPPVAGAEK